MKTFILLAAGLVGCSPRVTKELTLRPEGSSHTADTTQMVKAVFLVQDGKLTLAPAIAPAPVVKPASRVKPAVVQKPRPTPRKK